MSHQDQRAIEGSRSCRAALLCLCLLLSAQTYVRPAGATLFLIGGACLVGIDVAEDVLGAQLEQLGILEGLDEIAHFCGLLESLSIEYQVIAHLEPQLQSFVSLVSNGPLLPLRIPQLQQQVHALVRAIRRIPAEDLQGSPAFSFSF